MPGLTAAGGRRLAAALLLLASAAVRAHAPDEAPMAANNWPMHWSFEPWVLVLLAASLLAYGLGLRRLWQRAGWGRGILPLQATAFGAGWLALVAALLSPLDALGAALFSAHMLQHEVLMVVAAPLLVLGRPLAAWAWVAPRSGRHWLGRALHRRWWVRAWQLITDPLVAWALHGIVLWGWHLPAAFEAALASSAWHALQHASFLFSALLFWWATLGPSARHRPGAAGFYLFTTMLHTGALGALLTLAPTLWYHRYGDAASALGVDPLQDQALGGLVMWVPAGLAYPAAALMLLAQILMPTRGLRRASG